MIKADRNLDILRSFAVLLVLVAHCMPYSLPQQAAGHYAVLIFFVHTALVLLFSLERQQGAPGLVRRFYIQRTFRIYPLSILCVIVSLAFGITWPETTATSYAGTTIAANLLLIQNFLPGNPSISKPLWSLPYEIQMYVVLPAVFLVVRWRRNTAVVLAIASAAISIGEFMAQPVPQPLGGLWITRYVPCFMGGVIAYTRYGNRKILPWWSWPALVVMFGGAYIAGGIAPLTDWLICLALGFVVPEFGEAPVNLLSRLANVVARYSYGIYLTHAPLLWLCFQKLDGMSIPARWSIFAVLICVVPVALYHLIEEPMIRVGKSLASRVGKQSTLLREDRPQLSCL